MGFSSVYKCLQEVFPQVDARILKAVAIEHPKDADAAVESILLEVLPFLSKQFMDPNSSTVKRGSRGQKHRKVEFQGRDVLIGNPVVFGEATASPLKSVSAATEDDSIFVHSKGTTLEDSTLLDEHLNDCSSSNFSDANGSCDRICENTGIEESKDLQICQEIYAKTGSMQVPESSSTTSVPESHGITSSLNDSHTDSIKISQSVNDDFYTVNHGKLHQEKVSSGGNIVDVKILMSETAGMSCEQNSTDSAECNLQLIRWPSQFPHDSSPTLVQESSNSIENLDDHSRADLAISSEGVAYVSYTSCNGSIDHGSMYLSNEKLEQQNAVVELTPHVHEDMPDADEGGVGLEFHSITSTMGAEKEQSTIAVDPFPKQDGSAGGMVDLGDSASFSTSVTGSGQSFRIDFLESLIEDAKNNKKTLFAAVELVISLMREAEMQEKAAEEAREEASRGGCDILSRVEEMKRMLQHAKEANDMHSGEVYGEKAILTTEARELQARLLSLSEERDKSLAILNEMRQTLEGRLAAAEEVKKAAEQQKFEEENLARNALAEQELIMEKVVQESKILQQEAEENSKLQEFLMDRGRLVDALQGEISVICQDVRLLKEKFDERVPLSQSVSSSQTSCILASSSASLKSIVSDRFAEQNDPIETPKNGSPSPSGGADTPKSPRGDDGARDFDKELLDNGWDLFDL